MVVGQCHGTNVGGLGTLRAGGNVTTGVPFVAATLNSGGNDGGFRTEPGEHLVAPTLGASGAGTQRPGNSWSEVELLVAALTAGDRGVSVDQACGNMVVPAPGPVALG